MLRAIFALTIALCSTPVLAEGFWPKDAKVYFIQPWNGETVAGPVTVKFGLVGLGVAPAGVMHVNTGHHHLLIDVPALTGASLQAPIPMDEGHRHFGGGQTEATIKLAPGTHTLQLLIGDSGHVPHNPPLVSDRITIDVQ